MLYYILLQLKMILARNILRGVLPKGNYGRDLWVQGAASAWALPNMFYTPSRCQNCG
jgi:hypothetical protein